MRAQVALDDLAGVDRELSGDRLPAGSLGEDGKADGGTDGLLAARWHVGLLSTP